MKSENGQLFFSATDLANHLACQHATILEVQRTQGLATKQYREDATLELLIELGNRHEQAYCDFLISSGKDVVQLPEFGSQNICLLYTSPSPRDRQKSRMPSSA